NIPLIFNNCTKDGCGQVHYFFEIVKVCTIDTKENMLGCSIFKLLCSKGFIFSKRFPMYPRESVSSLVISYTCYHTSIFYNWYNRCHSTLIVLHLYLLIT